MFREKIFRGISRNLLTCAIIASSAALLFASGCGDTQLHATAFVTIDEGGISFGTGGSTLIFANSAPAGVTWSLSGTNCAGAACGTLSNPTATSVTYNSPATISGTTMSVSVTATSVTNPGLNAVETLSIYPVSVQISGPSNSTVIPLTTASFSATVPGDLTGKGVTFAISGPNCNGIGDTAANCGGLTSPSPPTLSATFTAPPAPLLETVNITATSVSYPRESATYVMTVPKLAIYIFTPTILPAAIAGQPYTATVQIVGNTPPYTDTFANLPSWATATPSSDGTSFTITGKPPTGTQGTYYVQASVADSSSPQNQGGQSFALTTYPAAATGNNLLKGTYTFYATGWTDGAAVTSTLDAIAYIGSFTADGNGNITGGELDVNSPSTGFTSYASLSGTYNIQYPTSPGTGLACTAPPSGTQTGLITLVPSGKPPLPITLAVSLGGVRNVGLESDNITPEFIAPTTTSCNTDQATYGNIVEFDDSTGISVTATANSSGIRAAGPITLQDPGVLPGSPTTTSSVLTTTASPFSGNYVYEMGGNTAVSATNLPCYEAATCQQISLAGVMSVGASGQTITSGEEDVNVWEQNSAAVALSGGTFNNSGNTDSFGRVTATINTTATSTMLDWPSDYVIYAISPQKFYVMSSDSYKTSSLLTGQAVQQNIADVHATPFSATQPVVLYENVRSTSQIANGPSGQIKSNIQVYPVTPSSSTAGKFGSGPQYQNASGTYTAASTAVGSAGNYTYTVAANGRVSVSTDAEPTMYLWDTSQGFGVLSGGTSLVPGVWMVTSQTATALNAGTYIYTTWNPTSELGPMETGSLIIPTGGIPTGPSTKFVPITGYDYTAFGAAANAYNYSTTNEPILYNGPFTGSMAETGPVTDGVGGIFGHAAAAGIILGPPTATTTSNLQGCGQVVGNEGGGFVISPTMFACVPASSAFSTVHVFQQ